MVARKFPEKGTPAFNRIVSQVQQGIPYNIIAESLDMTFAGLKNSLRDNGITRQRADFVGQLPPAYEFSKSATWEEHIQTMQQMDNLIAFHQRTPSEITIKIDGDLPVGRIVTADWHLGQYGTDYVSFKRDMETIVAEPGVKVNVGGDGYHNIVQPSKIGSSHNQAPINVQKGLFFLTLEMLAEKIDTLRTGNHNYWTAMAEGEDWDMETARRIKLVYMKHYGMVHYQIGNQVYPWLMLHKGRFNSSFNLTHGCKQYQRMYYPNARVIVTEHTHVAALEEYRYAEKECVAIKPGTYGTYDDYAQQNGLFGAHVCNPMVVMFPDVDKIVGFKDMHDGIRYLRAVRQEYSERGQASE